jgi:hypothetical protein
MSIYSRLGIATTVTLAVALSAPAPASANTASCTSYLAANNSQSTTRNLVCEVSFDMATLLGPNIAFQFCATEMALTDLDPGITEGACGKAVTL